MRCTPGKKQFIWLALLLLAPFLHGGFLWFERNQVYFPEKGNPSLALRAFELETRVHEVTLTASDGTRLNAWHLPAPPGRETAVLAHGNAGNLANRAGVVKAFADAGYGMLAFDYRGYGKSEGKPSEKGLYRDMAAASAYLVGQGVPVDRQIAVGESLGTGVAIDAAVRARYRAVALLAAYTSLPDVAAHLRDANGWGWLRFIPLRLLMTQRYDALSKIVDVPCPLLIMHGEEDALMPPSMPRRLFARAATPRKTLVMIPGAGHNDVFMMGQGQFFQALDALLRPLPSP